MLELSLGLHCFRNQPDCDPHTLDFHGLHVDEALHVLQTVLAQREAGNVTLHIVDRHQFPLALAFVSCFVHHCYGAGGLIGWATQIWKLIQTV